MRPALGEVGAAQLKEQLGKVLAKRSEKPTKQDYGALVVRAWRAAARRSRPAVCRRPALAAMKTELAGKSPAEMKLHVTATPTCIGAVLYAKPAPDASACKAWLAGIAEKAAEASTQGGFLGFGGVRVSEAEKATLAKLRQALKLA